MNKPKHNAESESKRIKIITMIIINVHGKLRRNSPNYKNFHTIF